MTQLHSRLRGTGSYLPPLRLSNDDMVQRLARGGIETSDTWIVERHHVNDAMLSQSCHV